MRVLVCFASRHGATEDVARTIGARLELRGLNVDVRNVTDVGSLDGYAAVVIGSAVYMNDWEQTARALVLSQEQRLREQPVWLFSTGPVGEPLFPEEESKEALWLAEKIAAKGHVTFPGKLDHHDLSLIERLTVAIVHAKDGDYRDWEAIDGWADEIADDLVANTLAYEAAALASEDR
ncbi:MAG: flavodoxin domain-containing protein [Dehalococcoidia bacterium]